MHYLLTIFLVGIVILVHETGHYLAARMSGMPIKVFSIGFGPAIWARTIGDTEYRISWIPIGGYVLPAIENEDQLFEYPLRQRIAMAAGGPVASLILPLVCFGLMNVLMNGFSWVSIGVAPFQQLGSTFNQIVNVIPMLFKDSSQLSGIVGIVSAGGKFLQSGIAQIFYFMAFLSVNLAVFNLLPIPALDGGKILLYLLEGIHPKFRKLHLPLALAGWVVILLLFVYTTVMDLGRLPSLQ